MKGRVVTSSGGSSRGFYADMAEPFALTVAQQSLLLLAHLDPDDASYNVAFAVDIAGALDRDAMKAACAAVFRRHEQLRVRIAFDDSADDPGGACQVVHPDRPDLFDEAFTEKHVADTSTLTELTHAVAQRPFDVRGPLVRIALLTDGADRHRLVVVAHHLVLDRRSAAVVFRDVAGAYNACRGATPSFGEAGTPDYREFVARNARFPRRRRGPDCRALARARPPNADCRNLALGPAPEARPRP